MGARCSANSQLSGFLDLTIQVSYAYPTRVAIPQTSAMLCRLFYVFRSLCVSFVRSFIHFFKRSVASLQSASEGIVLPLRDTHIVWLAHSSRYTGRLYPPSFSWLCFLIDTWLYLIRTLSSLYSAWLLFASRPTLRYQHHFIQILSCFKWHDLSYRSAIHTLHPPTVERLYTKDNVFRAIKLYALDIETYYRRHHGINRNTYTLRENGAIHLTI